MEPRPALTPGQFAVRVVIVLALGALLYLLWTMRDLLILVFGGVLAGVIFSLIARPLEKRLGMPRWAALTCAVLFVAALAYVLGRLFGAEVAAQAAVIRAELPQAIQSLRGLMEPFGLEQALGDSGGQGILSRIGSFVLTVGSGLADFVLVLVAGVYFAAQPDLYRRGLLKLLPRRSREPVDDALGQSAVALRNWLGGQLLAMVLVGVLTGLGLWALGVPAAFALGLLAGLLDFVPTFGPIVAAVPGVLVALTVSPEAALWTAGLYLLVQQLEGNLITPMVQQKAVDLPPALLLFALVAGGLLFGVPGLLLATPLTVVLLVMVKRLYVDEALGTRTSLPADESRPAALRR